MDRIFIEHTIDTLVARIRSGELRPDDLIAAARTNIAAKDDEYLAWETYRDANWKPILPGSPMDGPVLPQQLLLGIPIGVKDIYNTYDFPTQMGSPLWKGFTPGNDARAVFNLKRQGAIVMGKTVTAEFAVHALEKTKNPWDKTKTPGTSSSGSAVAVSLGQVPFATGTQTAGSIVRPASFCGIYGVKPSFGTIPRTGMLKTTDSLDTLGYFVIHQSDLRRGFDAMRISGRNFPVSDAALTDASRQHKPKGRPWRVAFVKTHTWTNAPEYAKDALAGFVATLSKDRDVEIREVTLPEGMERAHTVHETIYNKALSYYFKGEYKQSDFVSPVMSVLIESGNKISVEEYRRAIADQMELIYAMDDFFADHDVIISLSTAGEAPPREIVELPDPALMWTLTHLPVVSVPKFLSPQGLPFGFQVAARKYNDYLLFDFLDHLAMNGSIPERAGYAIDCEGAGG